MQVPVDELVVPVDRAHRNNQFSLVLSGYVAGLPSVMLMLTADTPGLPVRVLLAAALVLVVLRRARWLSHLLSQPEGWRPRPAEEVAVLLSSVAVASVWAGSESEHVLLWALLPGSTLSAILILHQIRASAAVWPMTGLSAALYLLLAVLVDGGSVGRALLAFTLTVMAVAGVVLLEHSQVSSWELLARLDAGRDIAAELAVARERLRFAGDLHDVQGHYLQAIALKSDLAARLIGVDDTRAEASIRDAAALARQALADTRSVVQGYRKVSLALEIANAVGILSAAGLDAAMQGEPGQVSGDTEAVLGRLVREGATNVLRHAGPATFCHIAVSRDQDVIRLSMRNDGAPDPARCQGAGTGLEGLRERFAAVGGELDVQSSAGLFELVGSAPTQ